MKIGILTQPLYNNYGGLIQNYALQTVLKSMGHEVVTLDWDGYRMVYSLDSIRSKTIDTVKVFIHRLLGRKENFYWTKEKNIRTVALNNERFVSRNINCTSHLFTRSDFERYSFEHKLDAFIVGSDQVWRPVYNRRGILHRMFLDFTSGMNVKRMSYAASFGVSNWEYDEEQTKVCRSLISHFNAVSVRESDGITLCREHLGVNATCVLDPTMLLDKKDYQMLIKQEEREEEPAKLITYILDYNPHIESTIREVANRLGVTHKSIMSPYCDINTYSQEECKKLMSKSACSWLRLFDESDYVICDSFHGTVFSIIFNKPFVVLGNKKRGLSRFTELLSKFGLEDRMIVDDSTAIASILRKPIDWDAVNQKREHLKQESLQYLSNSLN